MVGSTRAMSKPCGPIAIPSTSSKTTTGIVTRGETARTITAATAAAITMTSAEVSSTPAATVTPSGSGGISRDSRSGIGAIALAAMGP